MIRVLIVDDHQVVRQGLRFLLSCEPGIEVIGEAADGGAALAAIRAAAPDVVLLDLLMPRLDGLGVLAAIREEGLAAAVLVLTSAPDDRHLVAALRAGAVSYLPKTSGGRPGHRRGPGRRPRRERAPPGRHRPGAARTAAPRR